MAKRIVFYPSTCSYMFALYSAVYTPDKAADDLNSMGWEYADGVLTVTLPGNLLRCMLMAYSYAEGDTEATAKTLAYLYTDDVYAPDEATKEALIAQGCEVVKLASGSVEYSRILTDAEKTNLVAIYPEFMLSDLENGQGGVLRLTGSGQIEDADPETPDEPEEPGDKKEPQYIYPTGTISIKELPVTNVGFKDHQEQDTYTHIRILVAEILDDGTVGGEGHVWQSEPIEKDFDYLTILDAIRNMCEGQEITHFNVSYILLTESAVERSGYKWVGEYIVGGATNAVTFSVTDEVKKSPVNLEDLAYCLDPVLLTINRHEMPEIQHVTVEVQEYKADFEFYTDRNILEIDIAEYLKVLFANVDLFEHQRLTVTVFVKLFNSEWEHLETQGITITAIYGKNPDPVLSRCKVRVQWLDKYAVLHDEYFRFVDNVSEGASKQKYVVNCEEREDKTGEKSITLAKILANSAEREALKTIVFADHIRAWIGNAWKRVRIANTYKTGVGREKKNFEITIKYAL